MQTLAFLLVVMVTILASHGYIRVCYYSNWAQDRPEPAKFSPGDVDPYLCTHLIFAFAFIDDQNQVSRFQPRFQPQLLIPQIIILTSGIWTFLSGLFTTEQEKTLICLIDLPVHWRFVYFVLKNKTELLFEIDLSIKLLLFKEVIQFKSFPPLFQYLQISVIELFSRIYTFELLSCNFFLPLSFYRSCRIRGRTQIRMDNSMM